MENEEGIPVYTSSVVDYSRATHGGYGMNQYFGYSSGSWTYNMVRNSQVSNPASTLLFLDGYAVQVTPSFWDAANSTVAFRHNYGLNILYFDNHVAWHPAGNSSIVNFYP
jgi:prepilin-type processing-associated H-X9-DG protein